MGQLARTNAPVSKFRKAASAFFLAVVSFYAVFPVDFVSDAFPVVGWLDDALALLAAGSNVFQQFASDQNSAWVKILKHLKWLLIQQKSPPGAGLKFFSAKAVRLRLFLRIPLRRPSAQPELF